MPLTDEEDGSGTAIHQYGRELGFGIYLLAVSLYGVVSPYHQIGYGREMEKPPLACHKIIGIAATDTQVIGLETQFR